MIKNKKVPPSLLGIAGRAGSGKDLVGKIIQYLCLEKKLKIIEPFEKSPQELLEKYGDWKIKRFAGVLKQITCLLLGCSMEELEDRDFKEKELGEEWWYWKLERDGGYSTILLPYNESTGTEDYTLTKLTPRLLLQLLGTDCGRNIIHPNTWINSLMSGYKLEGGFEGGERTASDGGYYSVPSYKGEYPNWIITDMRFPNEAQAIKDRGGINIRVNRAKIVKLSENTSYVYNPLFDGPEHESETALDDYEFDYVIENKGTIPELAEKVREILIKEGLL